jgi:hypothetical protein
VYVGKINSQWIPQSSLWPKPSLETVGAQIGTAVLATVPSLHLIQQSHLACLHLGDFIQRVEHFMFIEDFEVWTGRPTLPLPDENMWHSSFPCMSKSYLFYVSQSIQTQRINPMLSYPHLTFRYGNGEHLVNVGLGILFLRLLLNNAISCLLPTLAKLEPSTPLSLVSRCSWAG